MKQPTWPAVWQPKLPLVDIPALFDSASTGIVAGAHESVSASSAPDNPSSACIADVALSQFAKYIYRKAHDGLAADSEVAARLPMSLEVWKPIEIFEVSPTLSAGPFHIEDAKEGDKLERGL